MWFLASAPKLLEEDSSINLSTLKEVYLNVDPNINDLFQLINHYRLYKKIPLIDLISFENILRVFSCFKESLDVDREYLKLSKEQGLNPWLVIPDNPNFKIYEPYLWKNSKYCIKKEIIKKEVSFDLDIDPVFIKKPDISPKRKRIYGHSK